MTSRTLSPRSATSGPGRAPASDGRARHAAARRRSRRVRTPSPRAPLLLRAEALFPAAPRESVGRAAPVERVECADLGVPDLGVPGRGGTGRDGTGRGGTGRGGTGRDSGPGGPGPGGSGPGGPGVSGAAGAAGAPSTPGGSAATGGARAGVAAGGPGVSAAPSSAGRIGAAVTGAGAALRERLPLWAQARCGLAPRTLAALAAVLVVAVVFAVQHFWTGRPQSVRAPEMVSEGAPAAVPKASAGSAAPGRPRQPAGAGPTGASAARIVVDVSGKVRSPGIQRLPAGSRVADALRAAGGIKAGVDAVGLNRARVLTDGEQVVVGEPPAPQSAVGGGAAPAGGTGPPTGAAAAPVSLSTATAEQLNTLPGVGPVLAQHIIDYRTQHGGFGSVGELREVNGIGDRRFSDLQPLVQP
ncbi:ComEA family DNA-binding protein [Streptomyces sp. NBC_01267]|nr:ComEA family DNA-binding protein [Streptomyces sp. NBC_01267]